MSSESQKITYELHHDSVYFQFIPSEYEDCESVNELAEALEETALEQLSHGAFCTSHSKDELWQILENHRASELSR
jgi:hypothetical protein